MRLYRILNMEIVFMDKRLEEELKRHENLILENHQQPDGSVTIPKVLQKWMGNQKIIKTR